MNLIDCSYFYVGPLQVMNARAIDDLDNNAADVQECINGYIEWYQDEFLLKMVGKGVASVVTDYLSKCELRSFAATFGCRSPTMSISSLLAMSTRT